MSFAICSSENIERTKKKREKNVESCSWRTVILLEKRGSCWIIYAKSNAISISNASLILPSSLSFLNRKGRSSLRKGHRELKRDSYLQRKYDSLEILHRTWNLTDIHLTFLFINLFSVFLLLIFFQCCDILNKCCISIDLGKNVELGNGWLMLSLSLF